MKGNIAWQEKKWMKRLMHDLLMIFKSNFFPQCNYYKFVHIMIVHQLKIGSSSEQHLYYLRKA